MKRFYVSKDKIVGNTITIDGDEFLHFSQVLRTKVDENICVVCGDENNYFCSVKKIEKKYAVCEITKKEVCTANSKINISVFQALPKGDKLELITQKLSELGVSKIFPFESEFAIAKASGKTERLNKIAMEATKQCGRSIPLFVEESIKFGDMITKLKDFDLVLFCYEKDKQIDEKQIKKANNIAIIIGSEGGFSENEAQQIYKQGAVGFGLGQRILRTETAAIVSAGIVSYLVGDK